MEEDSEEEDRGHDNSEQGKVNRMAGRRMAGITRTEIRRMGSRRTGNTRPEEQGL